MDSQVSHRATWRAAGGALPRRDRLAIAHSFAPPPRRLDDRQIDRKRGLGGNYAIHHAHIRVVGLEQNFGWAESVRRRRSVEPFDPTGKSRCTPHQ